MVNANKAEVWVARYSDKVRYPEYTVPKTSKVYSGNPNERYIEAVSGERFFVVVRLLHEFNFKGAPKVCVVYTVDKGAGYCGYLSKRKPPHATPTDRSHREDTLKVVNRFIDGQWIYCGLAFGDLESDEDIVMNDEQTMQEINGIGRIKVQFERGQFLNKKVARSTEAKSFDPPEQIDTVASSQKAVEKHGLSHVLKHVPLRPKEQSDVPPAGGYERQWVSTEDPDDDEIEFTFRYRSRAALIALGILDEEGNPLGETIERHVSESVTSRRSESVDDTQSNFNLSVRPTMSPTPSQTPGIFSRSPTYDLEARPELSSHLRSSLLSDDDDDDDDDDDGNDDDDTEDGEQSDKGPNEEEDACIMVDDDDASPEGELVGPGQVTPTRDGGPRSRQASEDSSAQRRKRAWSEVMRAEEELEAEEAKADRAKRRIDMKRKEIAAAKRLFVE